MRQMDSNFVPRPKVSKILNYTNNLMSSKKIIRLKTPLKSRQQTKLCESTHISGIEFNQESTILLVKNVTCSEELQVTLINEINKLYREISKLKHTAEDFAQKRDQSYKENKMLKSKLEILEREHKMYKDMYELEKENHERLRRFYELREKQWVCIVNEHKKILEEYDQRGNNSISDIEMKSEYTQLESMYTNLEEMLSKTPQKEYQGSKEPRLAERKQRRKLRSSFDQDDSLSQPKLKLKLNSHKDSSFHNDTSQIRLVEQKKERTPFKLRHQADTPKLSQRIQLTQQKNAQADEIFDSIVRKTYYRYKEKSILVSEIEQLEDMVKLKNAKTSTKERLAKTIRKLDFHVSNEQELKVLCECVEKAVVDKYKVLRGDYAFDLLIDKLKECQKLALSSNSQLERLDREKSLMTNPESELKARCLYNDPSAMLKQESDIYRGGHKSIELLLDSTIKDQKKTEMALRASCQEDLSQKIKYNGLNIHANPSEVYELSGLGVQSRYLQSKALRQSHLNEQTSQR